jgi:beta-glucanase (GH16 family)
MSRIVWLVSIGLLAGAAQAQMSWRLEWADEFDGPKNSAPDGAKWKHDLGQNLSGRNLWGNNELEDYTNSTDNAYLDGAGHLIIQAIRTGKDRYTSARLKTLDRKLFTYGKFEARIRIPYGQGILPAFWMLGEDPLGIGSPCCGEIDIMENIGEQPATVYGRVHGPDYSVGAPYALGSGRFADAFHVYTAIWERESIELLVDGKSYKKITPADLPKAAKWVFDHPFYLLLNLAVGGDWPGIPAATAEFPQRMTVDYVRVYRHD